MDSGHTFLIGGPEPGTPEEHRQLASARAAGFLDYTLTELRYERLVEQDTAHLRTILAGRRAQPPEPGPERSRHPLVEQGRPQ